ESARIQGISDTLHQMIVEVQIVQHSKAHAQHLLRLQQMADVSSGIGPAGRTLAPLLNGAHIPLKFLVEEIQLPMAGIDMTMPAVAAGINAVKEVHAPLYALENVCRRSHPHQVGGLVLRQTGNRLIQNMVHLLVSLPTARPPMA